MGNPLQDFAEASTVLDSRLETASKTEIAECARLLALNLAHYKIKFGELPLSEHEQMTRAEQISPELANLLASGMLEMLAALDQVVVGKTDETPAFH